MTQLKTNPSEREYKGTYKLEHISASGMKSWMTCGLQWRLSHIDGVRRKKTSSALIFGTVIHRSAEDLWKTGAIPNFKKFWTPYKDSQNIEYGKRDSWLSLYQKGGKMSANLVKAFESKINFPKSLVEIQEKVDLGFVTLRGRIDAVLDVKKLPILIGEKVDQFSGLLRIDLKTSSGKYAEDTPSKALQLKIYDILSIGKKTAADLSAYVVVTKTKEPTVQILGRKYDRQEIKTQINQIRKVSDSIRAGLFIRVEGDHCNYCDFREMCYRSPGWQKLYSVHRDRSGDQPIDGLPNLEEGQ